MKRKTNPSFIFALSFSNSPLPIFLAPVLWLCSFTTSLDAATGVGIYLTRSGNGGSTWLNPQLMPLEFPILPIEAKIVRPHTGEQLNGKVDIFGLARGIMFKEYRLEAVVR